MRHVAYYDLLCVSGKRQLNLNFLTASHARLSVRDELKSDSRETECVDLTKIFPNLFSEHVSSILNTQACDVIH